MTRRQKRSQALMHGAGGGFLLLVVSTSVLPFPLGLSLLVLGLVLCGTAVILLVEAGK